MSAEERLNDFELESGRHYRYLRVGPKLGENSKLKYVRDDPAGNVAKFKEFEKCLLSIDFSPDSLESIYRIIAALLLLGISFSFNFQCSY
jgi:myosin-3